MPASRSDSQVDDDWAAYIAAGRPQASAYEEILIRHYLPQVFRVAERLANRFGSSADIDDLTQNGHIGLVQAVRTYDPTKGASFATWSVRIIENRILDGQRSIDWLPRQRRANIKTVQDAIAALRTSGIATPSDDQIATATGLSVTAVQSALDDYATAHVHSLDDLVGPTGEVLADALPVGADSHVEVTLDDPRDDLPLFEAIRDLPERPKQVLALYYYENLTMAHIGEILGVTESRISQILKQTSARMRLSLTPA